MIIKKWIQPTAVAVIFLCCFKTALAANDKTTSGNTETVISNSQPAGSFPAKNPVLTPIGVTSAAPLAVPENELPPTPAPVKDPMEGFNRAMFRFNDVFDQVLLKPVSILYTKIVPKPLVSGFYNFFNNIDTIPTVFNDVLQFNFYQATSDAWRLGINSTIGLAGFIDVGSRIGLEPNTEDFGLTLARWGWSDSNYLVLPFLGPGTVRDSVIGFPVTYYFQSIYPYIQPTSAQYGLYAFGVVVRRADLLNYEDFMNQVALDKYIFVRDAYMQHRNYLIDRNKELGDPYLNKDKTTDTNIAAGRTEIKTEESTKPFATG